MAKRFTETNKWEDPWFRKLSPEYKLGWSYLTDRCDGAGVIDLDEELADFRIGATVDWSGLVASSDGRLERLPNGKLWIVRFVEFQCGELSEECKAHKPIFASLSRNNLLQRVRKGFPNPMERVQEKEKEKEIGGAGDKRFRRPALADIAAYCVERNNSVNPQSFLDHYESNGWRVGKNPMRDWKAAVRNWEKNSVGARDGPPEKPPEVRQVSLTVFQAHARAKDFKDGPFRTNQTEQYTKVYGTLKNGRKIESHTDPTWTPKP